MVSILVITLVLLPLAAAVYAAGRVREHVSHHPAAAKALYDHVFLPVVVGPKKAAELAKGLVPGEPAAGPYRAPAADARGLDASGGGFANMSPPDRSRTRAAGG